MPRPDIAKSLRQRDILDPRLAMPSHIHRIPTVPLIRAARAVEGIASYLPKVVVPSRLANRVIGTLLVFNKLEEIAKRPFQEVTLEDARSVRRGVRQFSALARGADVLTIIPPLKRATNRKIDTSFQKLAPESMHAIGESLTLVTPIIDIIASYKNPKQEYSSEMHALAAHIARGANGSTREAGKIIHEALSEILLTDSKRWPLLQRMTRAGMKMTGQRNLTLPSAVSLSYFAPEIVEAIEDASRNPTKGNFADALRKDSSNHFRPIAYAIAGSERILITSYIPKLLRAIGEILPENGATLRSELKIVTANFKRVAGRDPVWYSNVGRENPMNQTAESPVQNQNYLRTADKLGVKIPVNQRRLDKVIAAIERRQPNLILSDTVSLTFRERGGFEKRILGQKVDKLQDKDLEAVISVVKTPLDSDANPKNPVTLFQKLQGNETTKRRMRKIVGFIARGNLLMPEGVVPQDLYTIVKMRCKNAVAYERMIPQILQETDRRDLGASNYLEAINELGMTLYGSQWVYLQQARLAESTVIANSKLLGTALRATGKIMGNSVIGLEGLQHGLPAFRQEGRPRHVKDVMNRAVAAPMQVMFPALSRYALLHQNRKANWRDALTSTGALVYDMVGDLAAIGSVVAGQGEIAPFLKIAHNAGGHFVGNMLENIATPR